MRPALLLVLFELEEGVGGRHLRIHRNGSPVALSAISFLSVSHASRNGALSRRTGSMTTAHKRARTPCTAMPTMRNGKSSSQTNGYATNASIATGQQRTKRMHQRKKPTMTFLLGLDTSCGVLEFQDAPPGLQPF